MLHRSLAAVALTTASLFVQANLLTQGTLLAQVPDAAAPPAAPDTPPLPAAGSPEATALLGKALDKMRAYGRGTFATTAARDDAFLRGQALPFGGEDVEVDGGWARDLVWGDHDGKHFLRANGRMLAKVDGAWKLRGSKLEGGRPAPFTLDPELLFTALGALSDDARKIAHVEAGDVRGKKVVVLSLALTGDDAGDFADSGAIPGSGGGFGTFLVMGPGGIDAPETENEVFVALFVDPANGDLLRVATKVYETNPMMGNVQIQFAGAGADEEEGEDEKEQEQADAAGGELVWKKGLPTRKPRKDESIATFRVDFQQLGLAEPPALDDRAKALLRLR